MDLLSGPDYDVSQVARNARLPGEKGRDLLKQVRIQLIETAWPLLEALVQGITGVKMLSLYHDISDVGSASRTQRP